MGMTGIRDGCHGGGREDTMKRFLSLVGLVALLLSVGLVSAPPTEASCSGDVLVSGYYRSSGSYVRPYYRTCPDAYEWNNYSYRSWGYSSSYDYGYRSYRPRSYSYWGW